MNETSIGLDGNPHIRWTSISLWHDVC